MKHEDMSLEDIVEDEHPEWDSERELTMGIIEHLPEEPDPTYQFVEREENLESNLPLEGPLRELEQSADAHYFRDPELAEVTKAIEDHQRESPEEIKARYERDRGIQEIGGAIYEQWQEDQERPVLRQTPWDL